MEIGSSCHERAEAELPADGTPVYVSDWRRSSLWLPTVAYGVIGALILVHLGAEGEVVAFGLVALAYLLAVAASVRLAMAGLILGRDGVSVRDVFRTRRWHWGEISHFELRARALPRLQLVLRDGTKIGVYGFYARSKQERAQAEALMTALERRREGPG